MHLDRIAVWAGLVTALAFPAPANSAVSYHQQIAPILAKYCASCHRPGQSGPFPLLTYEDARKRAAQIAAATRRRYMPPWLPEAGYGDFADERRLTDAQIQTIEQWARAGAPEGARPPGEPRPADISDWQLGLPT